MSVFVRYDTVSIRHLVLAMALPKFPPVFTVSFPGVRAGLGCKTPPGQAGCNTNSPSARYPCWASWPSRSGGPAVLPCCRAPLPPLIWPATCWPASPAGPDGRDIISPMQKSEMMKYTRSRRHPRCRNAAMSHYKSPILVFILLLGTALTLQQILWPSPSSRQLSYGSASKHEVPVGIKPYPPISNSASPSFRRKKYESSPILSSSQNSTTNALEMAWKSGVSFPELNAYSSSAAKATVAFGTWRGRSVDVAVVWPNRESWASFIQPSALYTNWARQPYTKVITLPLFPEGIGDTASACIAGTYNDNWRIFAKTMKDTGLAAEGSIIRLGWEMNLHTDWGTPIQFASCWRDVVSTVSAIAPGLLWDWNVNRGSSGGMPGRNVLNAYPGDSYVNLIGVDSYDVWPPATTRGGWQHQLNEPYGLDYWLTFAMAHDKKFSVPEWGLGSEIVWHGHGGGDDPAYIDDMDNFFLANRTELAFEAYFNGVGGSIYDPNQNPSASAEYSSLWSNKP
jgi:hypothetical protein